MLTVLPPLTGCRVAASAYAEPGILAEQRQRALPDKTSAVVLIHHKTPVDDLGSDLTSEWI